MKQVTFNLEHNKIYKTYGKEYDRIPIDSILYLRCYKRVSDEEWNNLLLNLNRFKMTEMTLHRNSLCSMRLH
jgi:hypothetical protein